MFDELEKERQDQPDDVASVTLNIADRTIFLLKFIVFVLVFHTNC